MDLDAYLARLVGDVFGLRPTPTDAEALWRRVSAAHAAWVEAS
jgi:hypothetical protein